MEGGEPEEKSMSLIHKQRIMQILRGHAIQFYILMYRSTNTCPSRSQQAFMP